MTHDNSYDRYMYGKFVKENKDTKFKIKGVLRISWANILRYDKPIYMMLFVDKSCTHAMPIISESSEDVRYQYWWAIDDGDNNYEVAKALLGAEGFQRFASTRFGCRRIGVEGVIDNFDSYHYEPTSVYRDNKDCHKITCPVVTDYLGMRYANFPTARLSEYKVIDVNSITIAEYGTFNERKPVWPTNNDESQCYSLDGLFVETISDDFYVNVRDKPSAKEGKVIERIAARTSQQVLDELDSEDKNYFRIARDAFISYQSVFLSTNKDVIPSDEYTLFVHDILPGDWCKVTLYKSPKESFPKTCGIIKNKPSTVALVQGYVHASQILQEEVCIKTKYSGS